MDISWTFEHKSLPDGPGYEAAEKSRIAPLDGVEAMVPLSTETAVKLLRAVGRAADADRFEIAAHPDLAELNVQMNDWYGEAGTQ